MKNNTLNILLTSMIVTLVIFSYQLRIFEQQVQADTFRDITTAMWNVLVTITTVGYGDTYA